MKVGVLELEQTSYVTLRANLTLSLTLKNRQTYLKKLAVFKTQDFLGMFGHFSTL